MQLPDVLLPFDSIGPIAREQDSRDQLETSVMYRSVVSRLGASASATLRSLMWLLRDVCDWQFRNRMTPSNIGVVFGPSLYRGVDLGEQEEIADLNNAHLVSSAIAFLLEHMEDIFGPRPLASANASAAAERVKAKR